MSTNPYNDDKRLLELLERWQSGDFSRANEQELQSLADSDDFRRETVEGFWSLPETDHAEHLASLRDRLRKRVGSGRIIPFPQILAAVAAIGILVLAVVWLIPNAQKSESMTQIEAPKPIENQPIASTLPEEKNADTEMSGSSAPQPDRLKKSAESRPTSPNSGPSPAASSSASDVADAPALELNAMEQVTEQVDKMVASKPTVAEAEDAKTMDEQDDTGLPGSAATRSESKQEAAKMKDALGQNAKRAKASTQNSQPTGGWGDFQDYLRRNARLPEAARQNNVSGLVRLKFRLDINNQPLDFQIVRSLGYGCDEEAIRLVKAYSWQRGSDPELTLDVSFVR